MKKRTGRVFAAAMALLLALPSCGHGRQEDIGTTDTAAAETEEKNMDFEMFADGKACYGIEAEEKVSFMNYSDIGVMNSAAEKIFGTGFTGTDRSIKLKFGGPETDWSITADGGNGNVEIVAGSSQSMRRAIYAFTSYVCTGNKGRVPVINAEFRMSFSAADDRIDNSSLLKYIPTEEVKLVNGNRSGTIKTPEWADGMILVEMRPDIASIGGKLSDCHDLVDFYASVGVNALWLCPIYTRAGGNGYGNNGPQSVDSVFTGTEDTEEGWKAVADFVSYAHSKGIYILFDVITWGVNKGSPLTVQHPDWFSGESWGGDAFNWNNKELCEWFISTCVGNILKTGADGFRCDCEPFTSGYGIFNEIRKRLAAEGKYVVIMSEDGCDRKYTYDFEQDGVLKYSAMTRGQYYENPVNFFADGLLDIVDAVKTGTGIGYAAGQKDSMTSGTGKYYTNNITNHDFVKRNVNGNRLKIGYAAILAPFIPVWFMGDEFNAKTQDGVQYFQRVVYSQAEDPANLFFLEDVKKYIGIRRTNPELFEYWPDNHRRTNITEVSAEGFGGLQCYARYTDGRAVIVIPSSDKEGCTGTVTVPFEACGIGGGTEYVVTDLMSGREICRGTQAETGTFSAFIPYRYVGVYMIEKK